MKSREQKTMNAGKQQIIKGGTAGGISPHEALHMVPVRRLVDLPALAFATALTLLLQPIANPCFAQSDTSKDRKPRFEIRDGRLAEKKVEEEEASEEPKKKDSKADKEKGKSASAKEDVKAKKDTDKSKKESDKSKKDSDKSKEVAEEDGDKAKGKSKKDKEKAEAGKKGKEKQARDEEANDKKVKAKKEDKEEKDSKKAAEGKKEAADDDKKTAKKKRGWFGKGKDEEVEDVVEVEKEAVQVVEPSADKKTTEAKPGAVVKTAKPAGAESSAEKPVLLPDTALVSVLKDISKALSEANEETGVRSDDEKLIVGLAKQILDKGLGSGDLKDNRILAKENSNSAKNSMTTEAWASGDINVSDKLRGSVATVWGKRINGMLNVTIAGDCQDKTVSTGDKVGEFIVVVTGRSPVKSGFDIQSQTDATYWIGSLAQIAVDAACCKAKDEASEEENEGEAAPEKSGQNKETDVKKKYQVVLEAVLSKRSLEYLKDLQKYEEQLIALANQQQAEAVVDESEDATIDDTERVARRARYADDESNEEPVVRRSRPAAGDEVVARRPRPVDDEVDGERVVRRSRPADDEVEGERVVRRSRPADDDVDGEPVVRRSRPVDDEADGEKVVRRSRPADDKVGGERVVRRTRPAEDVIDEELDDRRPRNDEKSRPARLDDEGNGKSTATRTRPDEVVKKIAEKPVERDNSNRTDWSGSSDTSQKPIASTENQALFTANADKPAPVQSKPIELTRISALTPAPAQASSRAWESPAINASTRVPSLGASLVIPERAIAGKFLTVSVVAKDRQPERAVELSFNGATLQTDPQGQALYMIPDDMTPGRSLHIALAARPELAAGVVDVLQPLTFGDEHKSPQIDKVSPLVASDGILVIDGHDFDGLAEKNRIFVDTDQEAKVIAASPVQLRVLIPTKLFPGTHTVTIKSTELRSNSAKFDFVKAEVEQPDLRKTKGAVNRIVVRVQGTKHPVPVRVVNRTPDVIQFHRGDNLLVTTPGGTDNSYALGVKQLKKGDYKVEATIEI